jgi:DNA polymerase III delta prime subunit
MAHKAISEQLAGFVRSGRVPNVLLWGDAGSGKKTLLREMLSSLYSSRVEMDKQVMRVECGQGRGIRFIREELKFFGQSLSAGAAVKSVVLLNGDRLTLDAQSALRRCIELYNHSTRFFMVVEDKHKLLSPIVSRFCSIHVPRPLEASKELNLHSLAWQEWKKPPDPVRIATRVLEAAIDGELTATARALYDRGCTIFDVMAAIERRADDPLRKQLSLAYLEDLRTSVDSDLVLLLCGVHLWQVRPATPIGNIPVF